MRTRTFARVEKIRGKERNLLEVLRRQSTQEILEMFPPGVHPLTPLSYNGVVGGNSVTIYSPLLALVRASARTFTVDTAAVPDPTGGFGPVSIPASNQIGSLAADAVVSLAGRSPGTYTIYAAHEWSQENAETREPPPMFAEGAGVYPEHRAFFDHGEPDNTPIPREAYDPALQPETVSEWVDRLAIAVTSGSSAPSGSAALLRISWNGTEITQIRDASLLVDLRSTFGQLDSALGDLAGHIGAGGPAAHPNATTALSGFMSPADKAKLDNAPANINAALSGKADANHNHNLASGNLTGTLPVNKGGTGVSAFSNASGFLRLNSAGDAFTSRTPSQVLGDISAAAASHTHALTDSSITGTLPVSKGGTGQTSLTSGSYLRGNGTGNVSLRTPSQVLSDIGAAAAGHSHSLSDSTITGSLPVGKGGTNRTVLTAGRYLQGNGTNSVNLLTPAEVRSDIGAAASSHTHSGADITSGTVPYARLPVGAGSSRVAPGQANVSYPPVGSVRLVFVSGMTSGILLGVTFSGSVSTVDSYLRDDGMLEWNPGTELFGTWTALSTSGQGNNGHVVLAVRTA